jgi:tRNA pseudouridine synthase 10
MDIKEKATEILKNNFVCDHCLGRQFAQLLSGMTNEERGKIVRNYLAMLIDSGEKIEVNESNFYGLNFHLNKIKPERPKKCSICSNVFDELKKKVKLIEKELKKYDYSTFLVGCKLTPDLANREEELWDNIGVDWCESIKNEINRELGIELWKIVRKDMDRINPDITVLFDLNTNSVKINVRSIYVFGKYQKFVRNMPQTKWKKKIYKTSVQEIIEKPLREQTKSKMTSFHGAGREDINVRCLGWRPFVIELLSPMKRKLNLKNAINEINKSKKVKVKQLNVVRKDVVRKIKFANCDKTYRAIVSFEKPLENLKNLRQLKNAVIAQKTPTRVLRRRSDLTRKRKLKDITYKILNKKKLELKITAQSGLYIKELISGDNERTKPNISEILDNKVKNIELDVIKIHL